MKNFNELCYDILKKVPKGKVTTYRELCIIAISEGNFSKVLLREF